MKLRAKFVLVVALLGSAGVKAQDDLFKLLEAEDKKVTTYTSATFKSTRLINGHSVETVKAKHMDFLIQHRFGALNDVENFYGLDFATLRLGFEFGVTDRLMVGIGRTTVQKAADAFVKYKLLQQSSGARNMPVSVSLFGSTVYRTLKDSPTEISTQNKITYCAQVLIARKFSDRLSLQVSPTFLYRNRPETADEQRALMAIGVGGRFKVTKRLSINAEYFWTARDDKAFVGRFGQVVQYNDALSIGVDLETGGHVFQMHFTNVIGMNEKQFIGETTGAWGKGDIRWGFNISRTFSFDRRAKEIHK